MLTRLSLVLAVLAAVLLSAALSVRELPHAPAGYTGVIVAGAP